MTEITFNESRTGDANYLKEFARAVVAGSVPRPPLTASQMNKIASALEGKAKTDFIDASTKLKDKKSKEEVKEDVISPEEFLNPVSLGLKLASKLIIVDKVFDDVSVSDIMDSMNAELIMDMRDSISNWVHLFAYEGYDAGEIIQVAFNRWATYYIKTMKLTDKETEKKQIKDSFAKVCTFLVTIYLVRGPASINTRKDYKGYNENARKMMEAFVSIFEFKRLRPDGGYKRTDLTIQRLVSAMPYQTAVVIASNDDITVQCEDVGELPRHYKFPAGIGLLNSSWKLREGVTIVGEWLKWYSAFVKLIRRNKEELTEDDKKYLKITYNNSTAKGPKRANYWASLIQISLFAKKKPSKELAESKFVESELSELTI